MGTQEEKDNLKKIFAANLKAQMREKDVTTSDLSRAFDLPFSTVAGWVNGDRYPRMDKVQMLADYFGILKSELIDETEETQPEPENKKLNDEEIWAFREAMRRRPQFKVLFDLNHKQMTKKDKDLICDFIDRLTDEGEND